MKTILIIEDDTLLVRGLTETLGIEHYAVRSAATGSAGLRMAHEPGINLIILDILLPDKNGLEICRELRSAGVRTPILMLTSKTEEMDKVLCLETGADDYVTKPFGIRELLARIGALLRRADNAMTELSEVRCGNVCINFKTMEVFTEAGTLPLTHIETEVLKYLVSRQGEVVSRHILLNKVWGYDNFPTTRTVDNTILGLRKKIEPDPANPRYILTVHGVGYRFSPST